MQAKLESIIASIRDFFSSTVDIPSPRPMLLPEYTTFLAKLKVRIYGATTFERTIDFTSPYVHLFHSQLCDTTGAMCLIGIEDRDDGQTPDGWTDVLLPIFTATNLPEANACKTTEQVFYIDAAFSGAYEKGLWFLVDGQWKELYHYSVAKGLIQVPAQVPASVGYVEYYPALDKLCNF